MYNLSELHNTPLKLSICTKIPHRNTIQILDRSKVAVIASDNVMCFDLNASYGLLGAIKPGQQSQVCDISPNSTMLPSSGLIYSKSIIEILNSFDAKDGKAGDQPISNKWQSQYCYQKIGRPDLADKCRMAGLNTKQQMHLLLFNNLNDLENSK